MGGECSTRGEIDGYTVLVRKYEGEKVHLVDLGADGEYGSNVNMAGNRGLY
jgi:hypothetical protein